MLKIVDIGIYQPTIDYAELIHTLEEVADRYTKNKLTAPSAKEQYFRAILLFLANDDEIGANTALEKYTNNDPTFYQTRQHKFCAALIKSLKEKDRTLFSNEW
jgi:alpha-soluble NSF attachment protein